MSEAEVYASMIAGELKVTERQVRAAAELLDGGATVPFIARYRKEATGGLDEVAVIGVRDRLEQLRELDTRREAILKSLTEQGKLSDELKGKVLAAETMAVLEDIYLPFRPKRRTRATIAKERGLEPLAKRIFEQGEMDVEAEAAAFVDPAKEVPAAADALAGARDIIGEWVNENAEARAEMRRLYEDEAVLTSKVIAGKESEAAKYQDYFDWSEPLATAPSHRILAVRRGAAEGVLSFHAMPEESAGTALLRQRFVRGDGPAARQVTTACDDCYKRLMSLSMETEIRLSSKQRADAEAIAVFADNLRELLLAPALGQKNVLGVDPGLRTGCKIVCLDRQGKLMHNETIYPLAPAHRVEESAAVLRRLVERFDIEAIAVGNGTGGREAEAFCRAIDFAGGAGPAGRKVMIVMVNESGASVYSASQVAREEFPDHDLTVRGAVSIGRRLVDPLAELVKIDPKSIGVGQYQHDVEQRDLKKSLDDVVTSCVNAVGVEVNTASKELLGYVSGLNARLAGNVVKLRNEQGPFASRAALREVAGMGPKTFEQAAGFLRVRGAENPLDASAVHPESYGIVERMAADLGCSVADLVRQPELRAKIDLKRYVTETVGMPTLTDILAELAKPGRDPRQQFEAFAFADTVHEIADVKPGMRLPGIVTNVAAFGAFVDIGVHQDGLVHISELADRFIERPADVVKVQQRVTVTVLSVDLERKRIALSMKTRREDGEGGGSKGGSAGASGSGGAGGSGNREGARGRGNAGSRQGRDQGAAAPVRKGKPGPGAGSPGGARSGGGAGEYRGSSRGDSRPPDNNNPFGDLLKKWKS
jgi:uncharacterized protein